MSPRAAAWLYRLALHAYPAGFRRRHGAEMRRIFAGDWGATRDAGPLATGAYVAHILSDLARTAPHERLEAVTIDDWLASGTATCCGLTAAWIDFHASEVQSTLLVLLAGAALFSCFGPRRAWRWSPAVAAWLPAAHVAAVACGFERGARFSLADSRFVLPAFAMLLVALGATLAGMVAGTQLRRLRPPSFRRHDSP